MSETETRFFVVVFSVVVGVITFYSNCIIIYNMHYDTNTKQYSILEYDANIVLFSTQTYKIL